ncbi:MAG TPA: putative manganese-dependent inorganic diphosphatase [Dissulfurispiraceae bacterium]|nr:putative manganese-dependent inorganic diphosphatase [Dissulfurispiraceae bacterium]
MEQPKIVYVIGHKNPDTDSTCSAIAYSHFKNLTDKRFLFTPGRAGKLNEETRFILDRFSVPMPNEIESLAPAVSDLDMKKPVCVHTRSSVHALADLMKKTGVRSVPVVDDDERLGGIVGLRDIAQHYVDSVGFSDLSKAPIELDILVNTLDCRVISNSRNISVLSGKVLVAAMQKGTMLNRVSVGAVVVVGDQRDMQLELIHAGCSALIVTDGLPVDKDVVTAASERGILILSSPHSAFGTLQLLTMSEPVSSIMSADCPTVGLLTPIAALRKLIRESDYRSAIAVDSEKRVIGFITRTDLLDPVRKRAILVDHNEISQAVDGIEDAEILEIIDHHRVGDISTVAPIFVYNDPVGSTCTVVATIMFLHQVRIPTEIAGLLLSGILSDTLILTLSTTTDRDRLMAERLAEIAGVSIKKYGRELLHASINIEGKDAAELINADFKEFLLGGKKLGVSQMMVLDCEQIDLRESELLDELERIRVTNGYDLTALLVTNPLTSQQERVLLKGETWVVEKAFGVKVEEDRCILPRVLSRKKDFIPAIGQALSMAKTGIA